MKTKSKIFVAGHTGLIGSAILRKLKALNYSNVLTRTRRSLDLTDSKKVERFISKERPEYVILSAAKVGGIKANDKFPAAFIFQNLSIQNNVINLSWKYVVKKLLFLVSSCVYPKKCRKPIKNHRKIEKCNILYYVPRHFL